MGSYFFTIILVLLLASLKFYAPKIKGVIGENRTQKQLNTLDKGHYIVLHDLYVPKEN